jgi:hypothetical protein
MRAQSFRWRKPHLTAKEHGPVRFRRVHRFNTKESKQVKTRYWLPLVSLVASLVWPPPAGSQPPVGTKPCTVGDARAMLEALQIPVHVMRPRGIEGPKLLDALAECQYRLFRDGATVTFSEEDVILGGVAYLYEYVQLGTTRDQAVAELEAIQDRVWLGPVLPDGSVGDLVEQPLMHTNYKNIMSSLLALTVVQHRAFITQLPAGEYLSFWESTSPGLPDESAVVRLVITPAGG